MRLLGHTIVAAMTAAFALLVAPACADNDQSIFIRNVLPPPIDSGNGCVYTGDGAQPGLFEGLIDVSLADSYEAVLLVGNQMITRADTTAPRAESNRAKVTGAVVRVTDANGGAIGEFTSVSYGFVEPAQGQTPSYAPLTVVAIDAPTMAKIAAGLAPTATKLVVANIKVFGESLGGVDLESAEFGYPIRVCNQCLINFIGLDDPLTPGIDCNLNAATGAAGGGGGGQAVVLPCHFGQDEPVDCTLCQDRDVCKAR